MSAINSLSKQITKDMTLSLISSQSDTDLDSAIWAINWFNLRNKWIYNLYNKLAARFVIKIGGRLYFKGENIKVIEGSIEDSRRMLLIVYYPNAKQFLNLTGIKTFQYISTLRIKSVKNFIFGFTKRVDNQTIPPNSPSKLTNEKVYLVHHFRTDNNTELIIRSFQELAEEEGIALFFAGIKTAELGQQNPDNVLHKLPFIMDGILVFEAERVAKLISFCSSNSYLEIKERISSSFIALFDRESL